MKKQTFIGIDISKKTLDLAIRKDDQMTNLVIANEPKAIRKTLRAYRSDELVIGMENTGRYNQPLYQKQRILIFLFYQILVHLCLLHGQIYSFYQIE